MTARDLIQKHEGLSLKAYRDQLGNWTVGYGTLIADRSISHSLSKGGRLEIDQEMAEHLLDQGLQTARVVLKGYVGKVDGSAREAALLSMAYNLGGRLHGFHRMRLAIASKDWGRAAVEALDSNCSPHNRT